MNRSILIVICDFLLVSLLAFSTADISKVAEEGDERAPKLEIVTNQVDSRQDLGAVMRLALEDERKNREALVGELAKTRETAGRQQTLLGEREKQVQTFQQELETKQQQTARLQQEQANLQRQFAAAQTNIQSLNQELHNKSLESLISKEELAAIETEARRQSEQAAALTRQLAQLEKSNQVAQAEKQQLATQLQTAEVEKRFATEQASNMRDLVRVEREEKSKLADGVKALATESGALVHEIRENRPLSPNIIFNDFATNQVQARFHAFRSGLLGLDWNKQKETETVLATDGTNTFALSHVQDTPLTLWNPGTQWEELTGVLSRNAVQFPIRSLSFYVLDPRVVLIPVTADQARDLGCKVYRISADPFKFPDAVVVGAREGYYGECKFEIDLTTPQYLKMDRNSLKGLFGKFNPSRGDLVFSKTGELLGVMANSTYCILIHNFSAAATFQFGSDVRAQHTGDTLSVLYSLVTELPSKLQ
jgi:hypothetical protein